MRRNDRRCETSQITAIMPVDGACQWNVPAGRFSLEAHKHSFKTAAVADG